MPLVLGACSKIAMQIPTKFCKGRPRLCHMCIHTNTHMLGSMTSSAAGETTDLRHRHFAGFRPGPPLSPGWRKFNSKFSKLERVGGFKLRLSAPAASLLRPQALRCLQLLSCVIRVLMEQLVNYRDSQAPFNTTLQPSDSLSVKRWWLAIRTEFTATIIVTCSAHLQHCAACSRH